MLTVEEALKHGLFWCPNCKAAVEARHVVCLGSHSFHEACGTTVWAYGWSDFAAGRWVREMPTVPGCYFVAAVAEQGPIRPGHTVVVYWGSNRFDKLRTTSDWGGWWWSLPLPLLPPVPGGEL